MKSIKEYNLYKTKRSQVMIINMIFLVMTIVVFTALIPVLRSMMDNARHEDSLNCKSNHNTCGIINESPCYNASKNSETVACTLIDLYIPYIVIVVLLAGVAKIMSQRVEGMFGAQQQAPYPGY